jgi:hypothetical protein
VPLAALLNISSITVNIFNQEFIVNIEQTVANVPLTVNLFLSSLRQPTDAPRTILHFPAITCPGKHPARI